MSKWYHQKHTVEFCECDPSKTVYNSYYFIWFENARFAIAEEAGLFSYVDALYNEDKKDRIIFPVLEAECKFLLPIPLGAKLIIRTKLEKPKLAQMVFRHVVTDEESGDEYASATTTVGILSEKAGLLINLDEKIKRVIYNYLES